MATEINNKIFEPKHLRFLVFSSFFLVVSLVGLLIFKPFYLDFEITRYLLLIVVSIFITLLFFILWPHDAILEKLPQFDIPIKIAGPIVLWILTFMLMNSLLPKDINQTKLFEVRVAKENLTVPYDTEMELINTSNSEGVDFKLVQSTRKQTHLWGIVIVFPKGVDSLKVDVRLEPFEPFTLKFDRNKSVVQFPVLIVKKM